MSGQLANQLIVQDADTGEERTILPERLIVAGYTARDQEAVAEHIAELAEIGVPPPATVPAFYDLDPALLTTDSTVQVPSAATSGEVEPVIIRQAGRYLLAVGSDHTDRERERTSIAQSKAICPKPVGGTVVDIGADLSSLDWDELAAECSVDGDTYQSARAASLLHPADTIERMTDVIGEVSGDLVLYCGTFPLLSGTFVYGDHWRLHLALPGGTVLTHSYETKQRSL